MTEAISEAKLTSLAQKKAKREYLKLCLILNFNYYKYINSLLIVNLDSFLDLN